MGVMQACCDNTVLLAYNSVSIAGSLIRHSLVGMKFQVGFIFGTKHWKRKNSRKLALVRITVNIDKRGTIDASCSCSEF